MTSHAKRTTRTSTGGAAAAFALLALGACTPPAGQGGTEATPAPSETPQPATSAAPPATAAPAAGTCLDIRAALVKCKDGETMTHEGCPEPAYMQRCAPKP